MDTLTLGVVAIACGAAAVWLFMRASRLGEELAALQKKTDDADVEARKQADRAETMRKKLETARNEAAEGERELKETKRKCAELRDEIRSANASLERTQGDLKETEKQTRKLERRVEELDALVNAKGLKAPERAAPEPVEIAAPVTNAAPDAFAQKRELRLAELEAERTERLLEVERLKTERVLASAGRMAELERVEFETLRKEREAMAERIMKTELERRIAERKLEDNRRAYIITARKLELATDALFRLTGAGDPPEDSVPLLTPEELAIELGAEAVRNTRPVVTRPASSAGAGRPAGRKGKKPKGPGGRPRAAPTREDPAEAADTSDKTGAPSPETSERAEDAPSTPVPIKKADEASSAETIENTGTARRRRPAREDSADPDAISS